MPYVKILALKLKSPPIINVKASMISYQNRKSISFSNQNKQQVHFYLQKKKKNNTTINSKYIKWKNSSIENLFFSNTLVSSYWTQKTFIFFFLKEKPNSTSRGQKSTSITFKRFFLFISYYPGFIVFRFIVGTDWNSKSE